jgi:hypothetical protein
MIRVTATPSLKKYLEGFCGVFAVALAQCFPGGEINVISTLDSYEEGEDGEGDLYDMTHVYYEINHKTIDCKGIRPVLAMAKDMGIEPSDDRKTLSDKDFNTFTFSLNQFKKQHSDYVGTKAEIAEAVKIIKENLAKYNPDRTKTRTEANLAVLAKEMKIYTPVIKLPKDVLHQAKVCHKFLARRAKIYPLSDVRNNKLEGWCAVASVLLVYRLKKLGYKNAQLHVGAYGKMDRKRIKKNVYEDVTNHCWVTLNKQIIDITAQQFSGITASVYLPNEKESKEYIGKYTGGAATKELLGWPEEQSPFVDRATKKLQTSYLHELDKRITAFDKHASWWFTLTKNEQKEYLEAHPKSKLQITASIVLAGHNIDGIPENMTVHHPALLAAIARGGLRATAKQRGNKYDVELHPEDRKGFHKIAKGLFSDTEPARRSQYFDPRYADKTVEEFEGYKSNVIKPKPGVETKIKPLSQPNVIYRGMSYEEFENFKRTGEIVSNSSYNIGDEQKGLTYWSDNPGQATTYANDFAPLQFKAIIGKPAYVVAAKRPPESDIKKVRGTGEDEVGVKVPIKKADVLAVWEGTPFQYDTGSFTLTDEGVEEGTLRPGGSSGSSSWLRWERLGKSEATVNLHAARYAMIASSDARVEYTPQRFSTQADLVNFAKQELDLLNKGPYADQKTEDADMQFNMNDCIMELVQQFAKQDHSGSSAYYLIDVLNKLMSYQPLTPLTCDDSEWMNVSEHSDTSHGPVYQSIRCPAVFKVGDNKPYYLDGFVFREPNGVGFTSGDSRRYFTPPWTPRTIEVPVIQDHPDFWPNILPDAPKVPFTKGAIKDFKNAFVMGRTREKEGYPIPNGCLDLYFELVEEYEHAFAFDILKAKSYVRISKNRGQPPFILNIQEKPSDDKDADQHSPQFTLWHNGKDDFRLSFALREGKQWTTKCKIDTTAEPLRAFKELIAMYKAKRNAASKGAYLASASLKTTALKVAQDIKGTDERTFILFKTLLYWLTQKHTWLGQPKIVIKATDAPHVAWTMVLDYKHIYFNKNYSSSLDKTELHKHVRKSVTNTFVTDNIKDVVIHEFGHLLTWKLLSEVPYPKIVAFMRCIFPKFSADIAKINNTAIPSSDANVSYYGRKNGAEFLAETFSAATSNKTRNKFYSLKVAKVLWEGLDALGRNPNMNIQPALARLRIAVEDHAADNDNMVGEKVAANLEVLARGAKASRILTHIKDGTPFITISASRGELSPGENAKLTKELVGKLHKLPVSFIPVTGDFEETLKDGTKKVATEHSFFIMPHRRPGEDLSIRAFKKIGMDLCKHFDQQSIGFGDGKNISFIEQNGDEFHAGNAVTFDSHKIDHMMGFSRIGNKRFSFIEHERVHPDDSMADYGDHDWWQKLSKTEREQYVKEHPQTKLEAAASDKNLYDSLVDHYGHAKEESNLQFKKAIHNWRNDYREINKQVLARKPKPNKKLNKTIKLLDKAVASKITPFAFKAYRGVNPDVLAKMQEGKTYTSKRFNSVSINPLHAAIFGSLMHLQIPKGMPSYFVSNNNDDERELLLPRGTQFKIISKKRTHPSLNKYEVHAQVIPPKHKMEAAVKNIPGIKTLGNLGWRIKLQRFKDIDYMVEERKGKIFAMPFINWRGTYYHLLGKDIKKIPYMPTEIVEIPDDALVADMDIIDTVFTLRMSNNGKITPENQKVLDSYMESAVPYSEFKENPYMFSKPEIMLDRSNFKKVAGHVVLTTESDPDEDFTPLLGISVKPTKLEANLQALARSESLKYLDEGDLHSVMKEPAPKAFMALLDKYADHGGLRGLVYEHDLFVWPAMAYTHIEVGYKMGLVDEDEISPFFTVPILSFYMNTNKDEVKEEWKWRIQEVAPSLFLGVEGIEPNVTGDDQARSYKEVNQNSCMRKFLKYYNENSKAKVEANFAPDIEAEAAIPILNLWVGAYNDLGPNGTRDYLEEPTPVIERFKAMRGGFMRKAKGKSAEELTVMDELEQPEHRPEQDEPVLKKAKPYGSHGDEIDLTQQAALSHDGVFDMRKPAMRTEYDQKIRHEIADYDDTYSQYAPQSNADGFLADNGLPRIGDAKYWTNGLKEAGYKACIVTTVDGLKLFEFDKNQKPLYGTPKLSPLT